MRWKDDGRELTFEQEGAVCRIAFTGYGYGKNLVVRVAELLFPKS